MLKSNPQDKEVRRQSPERVIVWYDQELETRLSTLRVLDAGGFPVDKGDGYRIRTDPGDPGLGSVVGVSEGAL